MKFKAQTQLTLSQEQLEQEYAQARDLERVRLGTCCLFYPRLSGVSYLPYCGLERLYLRQEEASATMCCGRVDLTATYLMAVGTDGKIRKTQLRDLQAGQEALAWVSQRAPKVKIGYQQE